MLVRGADYTRGALNVNRGPVPWGERAVRMEIRIGSRWGKVQQYD